MSELFGTVDADGHLEDIELVVFEITEKKFRRRGDVDIQIELIRFDAAVDQRLEARIFCQPDF